uniref:Reverse transcriptase domain-containing protein n=1 Tax=Tanacetum cinerariifolium TaxID=118510 RepID=A0A699H825_TANCI|nr:reverse transcriptase domain-containing protein [Tanacetum cinerariifolium]
MEAPINSILSDSSEESVGSHAPRVILFGIIPAITLVIPKVPIAPADMIVSLKVGAVYVISPTRVLDLVNYSSSSYSGLLEDSLPVAPGLPLVSPFLCTDDSKADTILIRPSEAIPFGRPYRTHPNGPRKLLTARKRVGPFPAHRLAWRRVSHRSSDRHSSPDFTSDSSSSSSSLESSSYISSELSPDSSSERSFDSSLPFAGPSRKRCRSPATLVPSSTPVSRSIAPALADLLPRKRFRDSYSFKVSGEEHMEMGIDDGEIVLDLGISKGVRAHTRDDPLATSDISKPTGGDAPYLEEVLVAYEATRVANALEAESQSQNGSDGDNENSGNRNGGNGNIKENDRGVVGLIRWFEKMETIFYVSNCLEKYQVKTEIQKIEYELWNLTMKNNDLAAYTQRFQELTMLCTKMVLEEEDRVEKFIGDISYAVELADRRISESNTVLRGCTLGLLGHPFNIYLMPIELSSFDVVISMDWLANHHAVIVCIEKIMRIPYGSEVLIVQGDKSGKGKKSKLIIISCTKTQKYIKIGCLIFLAQVMRKETEDKSEEKRLEDVPTVQEFPKVFPEDFPRLSPT